jgi:uncharacterized protein (TIGR02246 family)
MAIENEAETSGEVVDAFQRYARAFQALDARSAAAFFNEPAMMITPQGVVALLDASAVEHFYRRVMAELPAQGYAKTEFSHIDERRVGEDLAVISGEGVWKNQSGGDLQPRFGMTYTLRRRGGVWRIVVATIHEPV